jgi:hypothetical protein
LYRRGEEEPEGGRYVAGCEDRDSNALKATVLTLAEWRLTPDLTPKAPTSIISNTLFSANVTVVRLSHLKNATAPMVVTLAGIAIDTRAVL